MNEIALLLLAAAGGFIWWKMKKDREPAVLRELVIALRNFADGHSEQSAAKYHALALAIEEGATYASSGTKPDRETLHRIKMAIADASHDNLLFRAGFSIASGRQKQAQEALISMWKKIEP